MPNSGSGSSPGPPSSVVPGTPPLGGALPQSPQTGIINPPNVTFTPTWDPTTAVGVTLDDTNLIVSNAKANAGDGFGVSIPTNLSQLPGMGPGSEKFYFEYTYTKILDQNNLPYSASSHGGIAIASVGTSYKDLAFHATGGAGFGGVLLDTGGTVWRNGSIVAALPTPSDPILGPPFTLAFQDGDVIGVAVDVNARAVWFKCIAGPSRTAAVFTGIGNDWNGGSFGIGAGSSPNNGSLGVSLIIGKGIVPMAIFGSETAVGKIKVTANFGDPFFQGQVPIFNNSQDYIYWPTIPTH